MQWAKNESQKKKKKKSNDNIPFDRGRKTKQKWSKQLLEIFFVFEI